MDLHLFHNANGNWLRRGTEWYRMPGSWDELINRQSLWSSLSRDIDEGRAARMGNTGPSGKVLAPIAAQELWAAGVTYSRSKDARMEESESSGASRFYDLVYSADRPELFFKSAGWRVKSDGDEVRIRKDSTWNVPEPELTLFICSAGTIEAYTIGNDMSSRSIEGENPLYLPQAKIYDGCASLGPCLLVPENPPGPETAIHMTIHRDGAEVFSGSARLKQMKRSLTELAGWLTREQSFPHGVMLMTGTCVVPGDDFTLHAGDSIQMSIAGIGTLTNVVAKS